MTSHRQTTHPTAPDVTSSRQSTAHRARTLGTAALSVTLVGVLAACSSHENHSATGAGDESDGSRVSIVATTTQLCDYTTQIANGASGDNGVHLVKTDAAGQRSESGASADSAAATIDLTCLLAPNASAHEHEMTPDQMNALSNAELLLVNGVDLEHFLDQAVSASGFHGSMVVSSGVLTASDVDDPQSASDQGDGYTIDRGVKSVDIEPWPFAPEPGEEAEFRYDPHVWTSPKRAAVQVANVGHAVEENVNDAAAKEAVTAAVTAYSASLSALDEWATAAFSSVPTEDRVLFTSHDAFGYLSRDYGIDFVGAALSDFNNQQDATAEHIRSAAEQVKKSHAKAIFAENSNNSASVEAVARAAGVRAIIGDDALYGDSLGPEGSAGSTYIAAQIHNITTLTEAWGGTAPELPDSLRQQ